MNVFWSESPAGLWPIQICQAYLHVLAGSGFSENWHQFPHITQRKVTAGVVVHRVVQQAVALWSLVTGSKHTLFLHLTVVHQYSLSFAQAFPYCTFDPIRLLFVCNDINYMYIPYHYTFDNNAKLLQMWRKQKCKFLVIPDTSRISPRGHWAPYHDTFKYLLTVLPSHSFWPISLSFSVISEFFFLAISRLIPYLTNEGKSKILKVWPTIVYT